MSAADKPLAAVRNELRVDWYRSPLPPARLRQLMQRSDLQGWWQCAGHLALVVVTGLLTFHLLAATVVAGVRRRAVRLRDVQQLSSRRRGP